MSTHGILNAWNSCLSNKKLPLSCLISTNDTLIFIDKWKTRRNCKEVQTPVIMSRLHSPEPFCTHCKPLCLPIIKSSHSLDNQSWSIDGLVQKPMLAFTKTVYVWGFDVEEKAEWFNEKSELSSCSYLSVHFL